MTTRFASSLLLAVAGGFVVVASQVFLAGTVGWLAFAIGIAALLIASAPALLSGERSAAALTLDGLTGVLAIWTIVASVVFAGSTLTWLSLAEGLGFVAAGIVGLTVTQLRLARAAKQGGTLDLRARGVDEPRTAVAA